MQVEQPTDLRLDVEVRQRGRDLRILAQRPAVALGLLAIVDERVDQLAEAGHGAVPAVVFRPARSEPALGSDMSCQETSSPRRMGGRIRCFCSSVPQMIAAGAQYTRPRLYALGGLRFVISSSITCAWSRVSPPPPYST